MSLTAEMLLALTEGLETTINQFLKQDQNTLNKLGSLQDRIIALELTGLDLTLYLLPHNEGIQIHYIYEDPADTTLQGTPLAFMNMFLGDTSQSLFSGEVQIKGDIELGQRFKRILEQLDPDWEECLSRYTGDLAAFKTGRLFHQFNNWAKQAINALQLDCQEYLQEESRLSPHPAEMEDFTAEINQLRDHTARLQARITRLQAQLNNAV